MLLLWALCVLVFPTMVCPWPQEPLSCGCWLRVCVGNLRRTHSAPAWVTYRSSKRSCPDHTPADPDHTHTRTPVSYRLPRTCSRVKIVKGKPGFLSWLLPNKL